MSTIAAPKAKQVEYRRSESVLTNAIDRWIYVFMAAFFIAITLTGFVPDSFAKLAAIQAGERPPFPFVLHVHSVLMGLFLLLLLAQSLLAATGRLQYHQRLGYAAVVLAPAIVVAGFMLVPTMHQQMWAGLQAAPVEARAGMQALVHLFNNIMLIQLRVGIVFPLLMFIAIMARNRDSGVLRTRSIHKAYWIWLAFMLPSSILIHGLWDTSWWLATAPRLVGL
jgi:hypothetical protein